MQPWLPAGLAKPVLDAPSKETVAFMRAPDVREKMQAQGFEPVGEAPNERAKFIREHISRREKIAGNAGIKPE